MNVPRIGLFIITKNEAHNLASCIESAKAVVSEIVVVDSHSTDNTVQIAQSFGARVLQHDFNGFTEQKNFALSQVESEWALSLDADETLSPQLAEEIRQQIPHAKHDGYELTRVNDFLGKRMYHSGLKNEHILRLVRTDKACYQGGLVHERLTVEGTTGRLEHVFIHHPYPTVESYFEKFNKYTTLAAQTLYKRGKKFNLLKVVGTIPWEFFRRYILKAGFLDGLRGLIWACFSAFYVFVKYIKLWYLWEQKDLQ